MQRLLQSPWRRLAAATIGVSLAVFAVVPVLWMFGTAFKTLPETYISPPVWFPRHPTLANFGYVLQRGPFGTYLRNSLIVSVSTTFIALVLSSLAGYAFSRYRFQGRKAILMGVLATQMFPSVLLIIPLFQVIRRLGLMNSLGALVLSDISFALPLALWLMKGFFDQIPRELDEAAMLDGCGLGATLGRVLLPLVAPGLVATGIFVFIAAWDEFVFALTFTNSDATRTLPVGLNLFITSYEIQWNHLAAMSFFVTVPVLIMFFIMQRWLAAGMTAGALKE